MSFTRFLIAKQAVQEQELRKKPADPALGATKVQTKFGSRALNALEQQNILKDKERRRLEKSWSLYGKNGFE